MDLRLIVLTGVFVVALFHSGAAVWCHSCNSGADYEGEWCADPMPNKTAYYINCDSEGLKVGKNYTMCRKFLQNVEGDQRIVRSCATRGKPERGCIDRTGTTRIKLSYCECEGDGCNKAPTATIGGTTLLTLSALVLAAIGTV